MKDKNMKERQKFQTEKEICAAGLEEKLHCMVNAGLAIQGINNCRIELDNMKHKKEAQEYSFLELVHSSQLDDAIALLGRLIALEGNDVCQKLGLPLAW